MRALGHLQQCAAPAGDQAVQAKPLWRLTLVEDTAVCQRTAIAHLHPATCRGRRATAAAQLAHQHAVLQHPGAGALALFGEKALFRFDSLGMALRRGRDARFVFVEQLFDTGAVQAQRLAVVGLAQALDQRVQGQVWYLCMQSLAEPCAEAVGQVLLVLVGLYGQAAAERKGGECGAAHGDVSGSGCGLVCISCGSRGGDTGSRRLCQCLRVSAVLAERPMATPRSCV